MQCLLRAWLKSLVIRALDLWLHGHKFDSWPPRYRVVSTGIDDRLWVGLIPRYVTSHPNQLSLLPFVGREMSTSQSVEMCCGWGVKAGWLIPFVDKRVHGSLWKVILCDSSLTLAIPERFGDEYRIHYKALYKCPVLILTTITNHSW